MFFSQTFDQQRGEKKCFMKSCLYPWSYFFFYVDVNYHIRDMEFFLGKELWKDEWKTHNDTRRNSFLP